jgi:hypothetical protein
MEQKDLRKSIKQVHVLELNRLSVMKCADSRRSFHFECRSLPRCFAGHVGLDVRHGESVRRQI